MLALTNARIITMEKENYEHGTVLIEEGKIFEVGENIPIPSEAEIWDAGGKLILPGFIDAHTHVGIAEEIFRMRERIPTK